jgi:hypothetical protein
MRKVAEAWSTNSPAIVLPCEATNSRRGNIGPPPYYHHYWRTAVADALRNWSGVCNPRALKAVPLNVP